MTNAELRDLVERRAYIQFAERDNTTPITPIEWFNLVVNVVNELMDGESLRLPELEQEYALLQMQSLNAVTQARQEGFRAGMDYVAMTLESFIAAKTLRGADLADVSGMKRAAAMVRKELT